MRQPRVCEKQSVYVTRHIRQCDGTTLCSKWRVCVSPNKSLCNSTTYVRNDVSMCAVVWKIRYLCVVRPNYIYSFVIQVDKLRTSINKNVSVLLCSRPLQIFYHSTQVRSPGSNVTSSLFYIRDTVTALDTLISSPMSYTEAIQLVLRTPPTHPPQTNAPLTPSWNF
jgi:hypothetical protein